VLNNQRISEARQPQWTCLLSLVGRFWITKVLHPEPGLLENIEYGGGIFSYDSPKEKLKQVPSYFYL
jgi:hypothetical protein